MSRIFVISDTHFDHRKILDYEPIRKEVLGVSTVEEMNEAIVERWNEVVRKKDVVLILGDFCFGPRVAYWGRLLNGIKRMVLGNHDNVNNFGVGVFQSIHGSYERSVQGIKCLFTHIPVHSNQLEFRYKVNLHGHLHSKKIIDSRYINCSIEQSLTMQPILLNQIILERVLES